MMQLFMKCLPSPLLNQSRKAALLAQTTTPGGLSSKPVPFLAKNAIFAAQQKNANKNASKTSLFAALPPRPAADAIRRHLRAGRK